MNKPVTEKELIERNTGERVTQASIEESIVNETYLMKDTLIICVLTLKNGFSVLGQSACADPANYKEDIGRRLARTDAFNKIWPLAGYELKSRMARDQQMVEDSPVAPAEGFTTYIGTKVVHAAPATRRGYNELRGWTMPADENPDDLGYVIEYADRVEPYNKRVPGFDGYVSWSPKEVFERAYRPVGVAAAQPQATSAEGTEEASSKSRVLAEIRYWEGKKGDHPRISLKMKHRGKQPFGHYIELPGGEAHDEAFDYALLTIVESMGRNVRNKGLPEASDAWLQRAKDELAELSLRYYKLEAFLRTPEFERLPSIDRKDMYVQVNAMEGYKHALAKRVARAELTHGK